MTGSLKPELGNLKPEIRKILLFLFFFLISHFSFQTSAYAACSSPAGSAGHVIYNKDYHVPTYCDGTNWKPMGPAGAGGTGCPVPSMPVSGLVGWWKLDETSGTSAADSSGNGYTGTTSSSTNWTTSGMNNGALTFNGTTDYVSIPAGLSLGTTYTMSAWVKLASTPHPTRRDNNDRFRR
jgi:hypothetical protein